MPWYNDLRPISDDKKKNFALVFPEMTYIEKMRCIENLLILIEALDKEFPTRRTESNLIIGTWNLKEFGHTTQRLPESYFYIAEIINRFDIVAIQEIKSTLKDLEIIMRLLGKDWAYMINDITEGRDGNSERSGYIYNKKRVQLSGLAGEIILWDDLTKNSAIKQLKRTPYITGFISGWKQFEIVNLHLHPGDGEDDKIWRLEEVSLLLQAIAHKIKSKHLWSDNIIITGDMNLYHPIGNNLNDKPTVELFSSNGFIELESLIGKDTNATGTQMYDRLFFYINKYFHFVKNTEQQDSGGVFNFFNHIYREESFSKYVLEMQKVYGGSTDLTVAENQKKYFKNTWRKNQMSDHYPVWAEIVIDNSKEFLKEKLVEFGEG
ncbi:MAG: endonuclease/exonuclease/phosphatase family protein [Bacteroidetes bacterium]|nr:endonuclease/exonuclease/phosphatase family protein [Bacteroidota bacterium]MBP7398009.1 endonuclease/exonuclease/phosphatase family protein [Chitinophagales bacterium]MBK7108552.1 endonuclease/exonuclease/phosphatase family protein [Bacteroidota bacterium]MBK8489124.1 endonuclease/exonuclease/phosphatase family protein [Bacteroidota bacterium]MBK8680973.1 endonuclease/exonuclease/phosphatase family protein [Bacteroidota bacterium]